MSEPNTNSHQDNKIPSSSSSCLRFTRPTLRPTSGAATTTTTTTTSDNTAACQASHLSLTTSSSSSLVTPSTSDGSPSRRYSEVTLARHASSTATGSAASSSPQPLPIPHTTTTTTIASNSSDTAITSNRSAVPTASSPPQLSTSVLSAEEYPPRECHTSHDNNNTKDTTEHTLVPSCSETVAEAETDKNATRRHAAGAQLSCSTSLVPTPMSAHRATHNITTSSSNSHALFMQGQTSMCEEAGTHMCTGTDTDLASTGLYALSAHTSVETSSLPMTCHDERDGAASTTRVETSSTTAAPTTAITQPITITVVPTTTTTTITTKTNSHNNNSSTISSGDAGNPGVHNTIMSASNKLTGRTAWMTRAEDKPHTSQHSPSHHHNKDNKAEEDVESAGCSPRSFLSRTVPAGGSSGDVMVLGHHASSISDGGRQVVHGKAEHDIVTNTPIPTHCVTSSSSAAAVDDDDDATRHAAQQCHNAQAVPQAKHEENKACNDATDLQPSAACAEMTTSDNTAPLQQQQQAESATCVANSISSSDRHALSSSSVVTTSAVSRLRRRAPALTIVTTLPSDYTNNNNTPHDTPITTTTTTMSSSNAAMVVRASATLLPHKGSRTVVAEGEEAVTQSQPWHGASCDAQQQDKEEGRRAMVMVEREGAELSTLTPDATQHHHNSTSTSNSSHGTAHAMDAVPSSGLNTTTTQPLSSASHAQPHYVTHHPSVNTIIIPAHNLTSTTSNMGSAALPPLLLQTHTTTSSTTSNTQHVQTQRAALYAEREPSLSACGTPFTSSPAVLSCRSSTPRTTTSVASSTTNTASMYSARSARYSHYRRGATLTTQGGTAATMLHGHHYCYYPALTLREWFPQLPASLRLSRERVYVHRSRERQLGKGAYGVVMLGQLYPPRTSVQAEREAGWSGYDMSRCGGDGAARTSASATTIVITAAAPVEGNNNDTGRGGAERTKSAAAAGGDERRQGNGEVRSGTNDVTASSHNNTTTTTTKTAVAVGDVMPMHQQPYSKYTVAFYDCGPQPFLTNFAARKTTTIMSTTADTSRRSHAAAVHDVTSPSSSPQRQHEEAQALIASPPPPPSSSSLLRKSEGTVQGSSSSGGSSRVSGRQAQLHRALTLSLPHNTHDVEKEDDDSEKKEEDVMGPTQPVTPTMTTPSVTHDSVTADTNEQSATVTEATRQQTLPQQRTSPALPPCEERTSTHMETNTTTTSTSDGVPHTTAVATTAPSSSNDEAAVVAVGHEASRTQRYSSPAVPRMPLSVTTQRPLASPQLSSALSLDTTVPSMTPTTNNSSSSSSPLLWLPTTTTTSTTNTRKSSAAAVLRASQLVRQSSPPLTFPALRRSPSLHGLTETTTPTNIATTSVGLMSTRPQTTTSSSVAAVTMMPTRSSAATTTTTHIPLVTSSPITTTISNSNAAIVAASALRTQRSPAQPPSPLLPLRRALSVHYSPHTRRYATQGTSHDNDNTNVDNDTSHHAYAQPRTGSPALSSSPSQLHLFTTLSPEQQTRHQSRRPLPASVEEHVLRATSTTTPGPPLSSSSLLVKSSSAAVYRRTYDSQEDHRATSLTTAPRLHDTTLTQSFSSSSLQQPQQHERLQGTTTTTTTTTAGSVGRLTPQLSPAKTPSPPSPPLSRLLRQQQVQQRGRTRSNSRYATPSMLRDASAARATPPLSAPTAPTPDKVTSTTPTTTDDEPHRLLHPSNNNDTLVMYSSMAEAPQLQQERHTMAEEEERTVKAPSTTTHDDIIIPPTTTTTNMLTSDVLIQGDLLSTRREATPYDTHSTTTTTHAASVWRRSTPLTAPSAFNNNNKSYTSSFTQASNTAVIPDSAAVTQSNRHVMSSNSSATHQLPYRAVAVKVIYKADLAKPVFAEAAHNEVVMASQLHHPCLVNFFGIAEDKDYLLFVMDLSEKGNLRQYLERYGFRHTRRMAPRFLADVVLALEYFRDAQQHPYEPSPNVDDTSSTTTVSRKTNYHQHYRTSTMPTTTTTSTAPVTARASWESNVATLLRGTPVSCDEAQQQQHSAHTTNASTVATTTPVSGGGSHLLQSGDAAAVAEGLCTDSSAEVTPHTLSPTAAAGHHSHANEGQHHTTLLHPISTTTTTTTAQMDTMPEQALTTTKTSHPPNQPMQQQHNNTSTSSFASSLQEMAQAERQSALPPHPCSTTITSGSNAAEGTGDETESAVRHCRGIVLHRDLKPDNLTLTWDYHVKIGDFGSACFYEDDEGNRFAGSPAYISPEVILHDKAGPYSDLWAMGCILYELLEGRAAFAADTPFLLTQKIKHFEPDSLVFSTTTLSHHNNNNNSNDDDDEWFSECEEEEEEQRMAHARDLVRQLLQPVPEARLGSRERGGFATLKAHPFFAAIDWSHVLTTSNLTMSNTNYAHEIAEYLRANETLHYCSPVVRLEQQQCNASPSLQQQQQQEEQQQQHHEADSNGCHSGGDEVSDETTKKKSSSTQGVGPMLLVLTSAPRLFLIDPLTSTVALTVPWSAAITVRRLSADCFALHLPATQDKSTTPVNVQHKTSAQETMPCDGQEIVFRDLTRCAQRWVRHIEAWLKQEDYHNTMNGNETSSVLLGTRMSSSPKGEEGSSQTKAAAQQAHPTSSSQRQQRRQSMSTTSHHSLLHHLRTAALAQLTQPAETTTTSNYHSGTNTQGACYCSGSGSSSEGRNGVMSYASWRHHHRAQREAATTTTSSSSSLALHGGQSMQDRNAATMSEGVLASALRHGPRTPLYPLNATQS